MARTTVRKHKIAALLSILLGLMLGALSTASFVASLLELQGAPALHRLRTGQALSPELAARAAASSIQASKWFEGGRHLSDAALSISAVPSRDRDRVLNGVMPLKAVVERSLRRAPASPHNWTRLGLEWLHQGRPDKAAAAWRMAVLTGRYVPGLMLVRLEAGFQIMPAAGPDQIDLLGDQVRLVAALDPSGLASIAAQRNALPFVRAALMKSPDLLSRFERELRLKTSGRAG